METPVSDRILEALDKRFDVDYAGKTRREIIESLAQTVQIPLEIDRGVIDQEELERSLNQKLTLQLKQARLESLLGLLLEPRGLIWTIRHDALWISPPLRGEESQESRTYDVANLLASGHDPEDLLEAIRGTVEPEHWDTSPRSRPPSGGEPAMGRCCLCGRARRFT